MIDVRGEGDVAAHLCAGGVALAMTGVRRCTSRRNISAKSDLNAHADMLILIKMYADGMN